MTETLATYSGPVESWPSISTFFRTKGTNTELNLSILIVHTLTSLKIRHWLLHHYFWQIKETKTRLHITDSKIMNQPGLVGYNSHFCLVACFGYHLCSPRTNHAILHGVPDMENILLTEGKLRRLHLIIVKMNPSKTNITFIRSIFNKY